MLVRLAVGLESKHRPHVSCTVLPNLQLVEATSFVLRAFVAGLACLNSLQYRMRIPVPCCDFGMYCSLLYHKPSEKQLSSLHLGFIDPIVIFLVQEGVPAAFVT